VDRLAIAAVIGGGGSPLTPPPGYLRRDVRGRRNLQSPGTYLQAVRGRSLISDGQQAKLERQIGGDAIFLVVAQGIEPGMRTVEVDGAAVSYVNAGVAPAYRGGFGFGPGLFTGFLLGHALAPPILADPSYYSGGGDFGGGDFS
jgi:hypothetical protein